MLNESATGVVTKCALTIELARYFYPDDDLEWIDRKRPDFTRLGYALQPTAVRFLDKKMAVPESVVPSWRYNDPR